jgi:cellulose synthase operon protein C
MHFGPGPIGRLLLPPRGLRVTRAVVLTAALLPCLQPAVFAQSQPLPEDYRFAAGLYKQQRWDLAADAFRQFIKKYPHHERVPYARLYLGMTLVNADHLADARQVLREYVRDYPHSKSLPDALYRVGECSYLLDDLKSAETEFQQFLTQYPQHDLVEWALPYLADTKLRLKQPQAARDLFKKALARYPQSRLTEDSKFGLARAFEDLHETDAATALYAELAEKKATGNRAAQSLLNLATIRFRTGKYDEASKLFLRVASDFPQSRLVPRAQLNAGFALYQLGQFGPAIEQFDLAAHDKQQAPTAGYWKGITFKAMGDIPQATRVLKATYEADPRGPVAEQSLFYYADCELRAAHYEAAKKLFLDLVGKWPRDTSGEGGLHFADNALHFAAEAALLAGSVDEAERLVERFQKEFPKSPLALHEEILQARVLDAKAVALLKQPKGPAADKSSEKAKELRRAAIGHLEKVVASSHLPKTVTLARFHLGRILQEAGDHTRAVEALAPLADEAERPDAPLEAVESLVIWGRSEDELGHEQAAIAAFSKYLALRPKGEQAPQALVGRAIAQARLGKNGAARADAFRLIKEFPKEPLGADTLRRLAERAYDAKDWKIAAEYFGSLAEQGSGESDWRRIGLSGLGWAKFYLHSYDESAAAFEQVFGRFTGMSPQVAEAGYMWGHALQMAGKLPEAAKAYGEAFQKLVPASPSREPEPAAGTPAKYAFVAGVQAANLLALLKHYDESDAAYRRVVEHFPKARETGNVLFDWANMLYLAKRDPDQRRRVREILTRVVQEFPDSAAEDKARIFVAELDLLDGKAGVAEKTFREVLADPKADAKVREDGLSRLIAVAADKEEWSNVRELAEKFLAQFPKSADLGLVRLNLAAAQLGLKDPAAAEKTLVDLKRELGGPAANADWSARVWVLLAEAYYQQKKYGDVEATVDDLQHRLPNSPLLYQAEEVLGRSFKNQAKWDKAIAAFQRVIDNRQEEEDETAAKSRLMIAECWFLQKNFAEARKDYLKVSTLYDKLPEWAAPALFQVGQCEEQLKRPKEAVKTYGDLIANYPRSKYAAEAKKRLDELHHKPAG